MASFQTYNPTSKEGFLPNLFEKGTIRAEVNVKVKYKASARMCSCSFVIPSSQLTGCVITEGRKSSTASPKLVRPVHNNAKY